MKLTTTARHFEADSDLLSHIEERLYRLKRYFDQILKVHVIMEVQKCRHIVEVNVHVNGHDFHAKEESSDMYTSVDNAAKSLERQIKKFKAKLKSGHKKTKLANKVIPSRETVVRAESVGTGKGIEILEPIENDIIDLSAEEAILAMNESGKDFILFNNMETGKLSFVYRRSDGHFGVIDTLD